MSNHQPFDGIVPSYQSTLVAVDKDKNSAYAFRWAINHLDNPVIIAAHVTQKNIPNQTMNVLPPDENDVANVFGPLREICTRKVVQIKEAVIDDGDFVKGILEFVNKYYIQSVVVGAAVRNALTSSLRILKVYDAPTMLAKSAPDFCSVYIISKGKVMSVRSAIRNTAFLATPLIQPHTESESGVRAQPARATTHERPRIVASHRESTSDESNAHKLGSLDLSRQDLDFSSTSDNTTSASSVSQPSSRELEAEMKRLRLELQQTMDMYSSACKEAISAKNEAKEIHQWKLEEARRFEEARLAEEAALHMAEMEKAKARAAMEAAEEARKMAEREAQKRMHAEMKARRVAEEKDRALTALVQNDVRYRKYTIEEIETATEKFSQSMKIGEGGYGPVYKGQLDHTPVAIKILRPDAAQGRKQFNQEVEVLSCIRHPNMVLLLGACPEYGCLVYEYMDNGSLEDRLLRKNNSPPIPWWRRFHIAAEIATALLFLHQTKPEPLVHRDLKPANILLDRNYVSKISDVGLARLVPPSVADSVTQYYMTSAAGTFCYIDPEYQQTGMLTTKSDIYSLGIMLLQIITAKPAMGLAHHVKRAIEKEKLSEMLDPVVTDWPLEEALAFAKLSLNCAELSKKDRPDLATVVVPELNRLRDFGWTSQCSAQGYYSSNIQSHSQMGSNARRPPTPTQNPHAKTLHWSQEPMSSGDQESRADLRKGYSS